MSFTPIQIPNPGAENPGGKMGPDDEFGWGELVLFPFGSSRRVERKNYRQASAWEKAEQNNHSTVGRRLRLTRLQTGGLGCASPRTISVAFGEVVFSRGPVPGGTGCRFPLTSEF